MSYPAETRIDGRMNRVNLILLAIVLALSSGCAPTPSAHGLRRAVELVAYDTTNQRAEELILTTLKEHDIEAVWVRSASVTVLAVDQSKVHKARKILSNLNPAANGFRLMP